MVSLARRSTRAPGAPTPFLLVATPQAASHIPPGIRGPASRNGYGATESSVLGAIEFEGHRRAESPVPDSTPTVFTTMLNSGLAPELASTLKPVAGPAASETLTTTTFTPTVSEVASPSISPPLAPLETDTALQTPSNLATPTSPPFADNSPTEDPLQHIEIPNTSSPEPTLSSVPPTSRDVSSTSEATPTDVAPDPGPPIIRSEDPPAPSPSGSNTSTSTSASDSATPAPPSPSSPSATSESLSLPSFSPSSSSSDSPPPLPTAAPSETDGAIPAVPQPSETAVTAPSIPSPSLTTSKTATALPTTKSLTLAPTFTFPTLLPTKSTDAATSTTAASSISTDEPAPNTSTSSAGTTTAPITESESTSTSAIPATTAKPSLPSLIESIIISASDVALPKPTPIRITATPPLPTDGQGDGGSPTVTPVGSQISAVPVIQAPSIATGVPSLTTTDAPSGLGSSTPSATSTRPGNVVLAAARPGLSLPASADDGTNTIQDSDSSGSGISKNVEPSLTSTFVSTFTSDVPVGTSTDASGNVRTSFSRSVGTTTFVSVVPNPEATRAGVVQSTGSANARKAAIGGAVGGLIALLLVALIIFRLLLARRRKHGHATGFPTMLNDSTRPVISPPSSPSPYPYGSTSNFGHGGVDVEKQQYHQRQQQHIQSQQGTHTSMRSQTSLASSYATAYGSTSPASQRSMMGGSPTSQSSQRTLKRVPVPRFSVLESKRREDGGGSGDGESSKAESPLSLSLFPEPPSTGTPGAVVGGGVDPFQDPPVEPMAMEEVLRTAPLSVKKRLSMMPSAALHVAPLIPAKGGHSKRYSTAGSIRPPQQRPAKSSTQPIMTVVRETSDPFLNQALVELSPSAPLEDDEIDLGVTNPFGDQFKAPDQDTKELSGRPLSATPSVSRNGRYSALAKLAVPERREGRPASRASTTSVGSNYVWGQAM